jgi:histidyl-tRNA synthetase
MGDVVLLELIKARSLLPKLSAAIDVFCLIEDESLRHNTLEAVSELRSLGLAVDYSLAPAKSHKQFKRAQELNASKTLKLERGATGELMARVRDLRTREEKTVPHNAISTALSQSA